MIDAPSRAGLSAAKQALLAERLKGRRSAKPNTSASTIVPANSEHPPPLSFAQQRVWFLAQFEPESSAYHLPLAFHIHGNLDVAALERSFEHIMQRHEVLRTTFAVRGGKPVQVVAPAAFALPSMELGNVPAHALGHAIQTQFDIETHQHFDLGKGPPHSRSSTSYRCHASGAAAVHSSHRVR